MGSHTSVASESFTELQQSNDDNNNDPMVSKKVKLFYMSFKKAMILRFPPSRLMF